MASTVTMNGKKTEATPGVTLYDLANRLEVPVPTSCFGQGKCKECLVEIKGSESALSPRTAEEEHLPEEFRLSCQAHILEGAQDLQCQTLRRGALRIQETSQGLDTSLAKLDPAVQREAGSTGRLLGIAVDLGTTTIALHLYDLSNGRLLATSSLENPQRFGGSDIMARIRYDTEHPGRLLQRTLLGYLGRTIAELPCDDSEIYEIVIAGNPTMRDLFFGLDVESIGQKPYASLTEKEFRSKQRLTTALTVPAKKFRLPLHPKAQAYGLPLIGSHVGADAAACLLATGLAGSKEVAVLMDIGTNTEVIATDGKRLAAASCPAGPAFEGGDILCGMPALPGAIERVRILESGKIRSTVIGGGSPQGICGSGLVDLLGELLRTGQMNSRGRFVDGGDRFAVGPEGRPFLAESDISELAQAKGANAAGLQVLLGYLGLSLQDIEKFYFAGGFAQHVDIEAAQRIGLLPDLPREKILQVGNASLLGASMVLRSFTSRQKLEETCALIEHVELETDPSFFDYFVDGCQFAIMGEATV